MSSSPFATTSAKPTSIADLLAGSSAPHSFAASSLSPSTTASIANASTTPMPTAAASLASPFSSSASSAFSLSPSSFSSPFNAYPSSSSTSATPSLFPSAFSSPFKLSAASHSTFSSSPAFSSSSASSSSSISPPTSAFSSTAPARLSNKRSSASLGRSAFADDDDDSDTNTKRARPPAAFDSQEYGEYDDDEDEEKERTGEEQDGDMGEEKEGSSGGGGGDAFFALVQHFASLEFPDHSSQPEQCPICSESFPLSAFAAHVYECLRALDDVERKELERLGEKTAREIIEREMDADEQVYNSNRFIRSTLPGVGRGMTMGMHTDDSAVNVCQYGKACRRVDERHFRALSHPPVDCPVCNHPIDRADINNHLETCIGEQNHANGNHPNADASSSMHTTSDVHTSSSNQLSSSSPSATLGLFGSVATPAFTSAAFSNLRSDSRVKPSGKLKHTNDDDDDAQLPIRRDDDDDDDGDEGVAAVEQDMSQVDDLTSPSRSASSAAALKAARDLSVQQVSAMASMVMRTKDKGNKASDNGDPSLLQLLETFKHLGFNKQTLSRLKDEQQQQHHQHHHHAHSAPTTQAHTVQSSPTALHPAPSPPFTLPSFIPTLAHAQPTPTPSAAHTQVSSSESTASPAPVPLMNPE